MPTTTAGYADLELRIKRSRKVNAGYDVELTLSGEQEFAGRLKPGILPWYSGGEPSADGRRLLSHLLDDRRLREAWGKVIGQGAKRRIRLRIDDDARELEALPWELLREESPPRYLAASTATPFSRYLAGPWRPGSPILQRPIKLLAIIANPEFANSGFSYLPAVDIDAELRLLEEATEGTDIAVDPLPQPCTLASLGEKLREGYHILHFVGHGVYSQKHGAALLLSDDENQVRRVKTSELAEILANQLSDPNQEYDNKLRLVFLSSCNTARQSPADAFLGLAPELVHSGVPAVVAMQDLVPIPTARVFASSFYRRLLQHGLVDLACNEARSSIVADGLPGVSVPTLYMRLRSGNLFGSRGQFVEGSGDSFWDVLLKNIYCGQCTPILGPGVVAGLLPQPDDLAEALAKAHSYPFEDGIRNLPRVAQYVASLDGVRLREDVIQQMKAGFKNSLGLKDESKVGPRSRKVRFRGSRVSGVVSPQRSLVETISDSDFSRKSRVLLESEIHHQLAELPFSLYLTTNFDNFMTLALEAQGGVEKVRRLSLFDPPSLIETSVDQQYPDLEPTVFDPVVLHLFGTEDDLSKMIITQDNYLDYLAYVAREHEHLLPSSVQKMLTENTLLFLGYRLQDLDLKVITRGLLPPLKLERYDRLRVVVQIEDLPGDEARRASVIQYFQNYFSKLQRPKINVYWGTTQQFVADLHARWQQRLPMMKPQDCR